jgi:hypothetical protein
MVLPPMVFRICIQSHRDCRSVEMTIPTPNPASCKDATCSTGGASLRDAELARIIASSTERFIPDGMKKYNQVVRLRIIIKINNYPQS